MLDNSQEVRQRPGILCRVQVSVAQCSLIVLSPPTRWKCAFSLAQYQKRRQSGQYGLKLRFGWSFSAQNLSLKFLSPKYQNTPIFFALVFTLWILAPSQVSECKAPLSKVRLTEILIWVFFSVYSVHIVFLSFVFLLMFFKLRDRYTQNTRVGEWRQIFWARRGKQASASAPPSISKRFSENRSLRLWEVCARRHSNYLQLKAYISKMQFLQIR